MTRLALALSTCVLISAPVLAQEDLFPVGDLRMVDSIGTVMDAAGVILNDAAVAVPPTYFAPFDDLAELTLDVPGAHFDAWSDQISDISGTTYTASGSTHMDAGWTAPALAQGNTCSRFTVPFNNMRSYDVALTATVTVDYDAAVNGPYGWARVRMSHGGEFILDQGVMEAPGTAVIAFNDRLPPGTGALLVESHSYAPQGAAAVAGIATTTFELNAEFSLTGDLNGDDHVDAADLAIMLGAWGPCPECAADLTQDGAVTASDLALLLGNWG